MITLSPDETKEMNKELVRRFYGLAFVEHDLNGADQLMSPDYVLHDPTVRGGQLSGRGAWKKIQGHYFKIIPDHHFAIDDQVAEGDKVATRWKAHGTVSDKPVEVSGITITRVQDGQIAEEWQDWDSQGLYRQIGSSPELAA